jgi:two-component system, NtrC family, response regulator HydG
MARSTIMVIDDQDIMRESLQETLSRAGYLVRPYESPSEAMASLARGRCDLVITDMKMPEMDGLDVVSKVKEHDRDLPVVVITGHATIGTAVEAMRRGAIDYITKPFRAEEIELVVQKALRHTRLVEENRFLRRELAAGRTELVGATAGLKAVTAIIERVAASDSTVLVRGESGTGKEVVARMIHERSKRADKPFIRVNCAALSSGLLESEMFGHEKGAFTGADARRIGRFELADGGTILLDEVSEMDLNLQGKLLRVLQENEFERVGSSETIRVDVRVVATSNRDLEASIAAGKFREDLFFRLNVVPVHLPPLRERTRDIPELARHFAARLTGGKGRITDEAVAALAEYSWPGNVRELANIIERAIVLHPGAVIDKEHIMIGPAPGKPGAADAGFSPGTPMEDVEREHILATLRHLKGHRQKTAEALGIAERTLRDKLKKYKSEGEEVETNGQGGEKPGDL